MENSARRFAYVTLDVFTETRFGGNPLAVFTAAEGMSDAEMQALAAEMNYSETTFVLPPSDPANTARVRIFHRTAEMPFAGHPNVGTGFVLAGLRPEAGDTLRFEEIAGLVEIRIERDETGQVLGAEIDAPQPLQLLGTLPVPGITACLSLDPADIVTTTHVPTRASLGVDFVFVEVTEEALGFARPDIAAYQRLAEAENDTATRLSIFFYAREDSRIRARMFSPLTGTWEDPATGSANATLGALLLSLGKGDRFDVRQGVEMGRPSTLTVRARQAPDGIRASVAGRCVPVFRGEVEL
ncbi:PhzF family phenazine biosynthesis protein [Sphingomonas kyeonggiensis]|uniref:Trans-2,3-dihydro-3-hydroxyanthranilate isomerase n=1 Tax=Sphingomonas kyeonggiensis TaxID=1268553 RepID=A0A7W6NWP4_9SPHN|nr:PhzF family phenazine biosynthesis protein [Sphingomonas kyeonggiensis]MBB4097719.1 trans-2,3-dihydro-3-hydroxyanthranilate isomerase [Sphingomonas kyeonggiensis]